MKYCVLLVTANHEEAQAIGRLLQQAGYKPHVIQELDQVEAIITVTACMAILIDIDSVDVSNRTLREMTLQFPDVCFLCTSKDRFHPELKDAICYHIYACINKPIDPDELLYWMKSIQENQPVDVLDRR